MNGPNAWDEEKVQSFFSKFGGIEAVKVVRPGGYLPLHAYQNQRLTVIIVV
jgi:hypothetical protein